MEAYDLEGYRNEERIIKLKEKIIEIDPDREYSLAEIITGDPGLRNYLEKQKQYLGIEVIAQLNEAILELGGSLDDITETEERPDAKILEFPKKEEKSYFNPKDSTPLYLHQNYHEVLTHKEEVKAGKRIHEARNKLKHLNNAIKKEKGKED